ncbi:finger DZIP1L-like [Octopus vulgaris]|uniref:Finger DZIP1L-like n=1 Tax=Octopus vulgaris TaxID=6645 RepID=A0AA36F683_OCTVU|nr:finger DZIP1L-like [Octopus vulgaris]
MTPTAGSYAVLATRRKTEHVDWRKIAALNIDQMYQTFDYNTLQENIYGITFCDIEQEVDNKIIDPNYIKLFKLSQLIIEYLLNSQEYLTHQLGSVEERIKKHEQKENELKQQIEKFQKELSKVSRESHKRKKLLMAQQQLIHGVPGNYHKCPYCPKAFLHHSYLQTHLTKRHSDITVVPTTAVNTDGDSSSGHGSGSRSIMPASDANNLAFEKELKLLRDQLQAFEERDTQKHKETANMWKLFHERDLQYEANLKELMKKFSVKQTNLGAIRDDDDEVDAVPQALPKNMSTPVVQESNRKKKSVVLAHQENKAVFSAAPKKSQEDLAVFRKEAKLSEKLLQKKIQNLEKNFTSHLKDQEKMWRLQMEELKKKHKEEMLQKSQEKIQLNQKKAPTVTKAAKKKLNFFQKSEKSAISKKQTLPLEEKASVDTFSFHISPVKDRDADRVIDMVEEIENIEEDDNNDDDDEEEEEEAEEEDEDDDDEDEEEDEERTNDDDHGTQNSLYDTQTYNELMQKMYKQVSENPKILKEMKSEMADLLTEKLEKIGFPASTKAISTKSYQDKISILKKDRVNKAKKYPGFYKERKRLDELVNTIAKKKLQASEKSMKTVKESKTVVKAPKVRSPQQTVRFNSKKDNSNKMPKKQQQPKQQQASHRPIDTFAPRPIISKAEIHSQGASSSHEPVPSIRISTATMSNGPKQKPTTTWSESDDSDKEKTDSWTDTDVSSLLNDQHYNTPAKSPATPARSVALDKVQPSHHAENPKRQPVPLPRKNVISDFDAEDSSDFDAGNILTGHSKKTLNRPTATPTKGTKVAEIGNMIQSQLENRPHVKFPGAVDLMKKPEYTEADDSDFSKISLLDEDINDNRLRNPKYTSTPASRTALDTEVSTNTYSTSKWGSSSKVVSSLSSFDST